MRGSPHDIFGAPRVDSGVPRAAARNLMMYWRFQNPGLLIDKSLPKSSS